MVTGLLPLVTPAKLDPRVMVVVLPPYVKLKEPPLRLPAGSVKVKLPVTARMVFAGAEFGEKVTADSVGALGLLELLELLEVLLVLPPPPPPPPPPHAHNRHRERIANTAGTCLKPFMRHPSSTRFV
jgi:hypothetical protein